MLLSFSFSPPTVNLINFHAFFYFYKTFIWGYVELNSLIDIWYTHESFVRFNQLLRPPGELGTSLKLTLTRRHTHRHLRPEKEAVSVVRSSSKTAYPPPPTTRGARRGLIEPRGGLREVVIEGKRLMTNEKYGATTVIDAIECFFKPWWEAITLLCHRVGNGS